MFAVRLSPHFSVSSLWVREIVALLCASLWIEYGEGYILSGFTHTLPMHKSYQIQLKHSCIQSRISRAQVDLGMSPVYILCVFMVHPSISSLPNDHLLKLLAALLSYSFAASSVCVFCMLQEFSFWQTKPKMLLRYSRRDFK